MIPIGNDLSLDIELEVQDVLYKSIKGRIAKVMFEVVPGTRDVVGNIVAQVPNSCWKKINDAS